jgi:hypothetical protein
MSERVTFSTFDPVRFDSPSHCDLCTSRTPVFHYEHTVDEAARQSPKRGFCCASCAARLLATLQNTESRVRAEEEASLKADDADASDLEERRLVTLGNVRR